ncbi:hypothetical protein C8R27_102165 [Nitrosomonas ureae]|nr:hypothetical protein C8R27_102165 [Nitrosomonas ureae]
MEAAESKGERYNPTQNDEQRRSFDNLLILCHKHHVETDEVEEYPIQRLREIKATHEAAHGKKTFKVDESVIFQLESEMLKYWADVEKANNFEYVAPEFSVEIDKNKSPKELFAALYEAASNLEEFTNMLREWNYTLDNEIRSFLLKAGYDTTSYDAIPYYENPFANRAWEIHNLGIPNKFTDLTTLLLQVEVRFLEEYLKTHANDGVTTLRFKEAKTELMEMARSAGYAD